MYIMYYAILTPTIIRKNVPMNCCKFQELPKKLFQYCGMRCRLGSEKCFPGPNVRFRGRVVGCPAKYEMVDSNTRVRIA